MLKQVIIYLVLSLLVVLFASYLHAFFVLVDTIYVFFNHLLSGIFNNSKTAEIIQKVLLLAILPIVIAAIPAVPYRLVTGRNMPYFYEVAWCVWLMVVVSIFVAR